MSLRRKRRLTAQVVRVGNVHLLMYVQDSRVIYLEACLCLTQVTLKS